MLLGLVLMILSQFDDSDVTATFWPPDLLIAARKAVEGLSPQRIFPRNRREVSSIALASGPRLLHPRALIFDFSTKASRRKRTDSLSIFAMWQRYADRLVCP